MYVLIAIFWGARQAMLIFYFFFLGFLGEGGLAAFRDFCSLTL